MQKTLIIILGPTGIGKTRVSIKVANQLKTEIISSDSRQIFKELKIGTASPTTEELKQVTHHNIGTHSINDYYSAWEFEQDALNIATQLFKTHNQVVLTGGSMMYIEAVTKGIDEIPTVDEELRNDLENQYQEEGIDNIKRTLKQLDPVFYNQIDLQNHKRVIHAVEICLMTGQPYSNLRTNSAKTRPFKILQIGLDMDRQELYERINNRVDQMIKDGLIDEARQYYSYKHLNSLNTVGYKELFEHFDGHITQDKAIELIKRNSRRYAKKQLSWFKRDKTIQWFHPKDYDQIIEYIKGKI